MEQLTSRLSYCAAPEADLREERKSKRDLCGMLQLHNSLLGAGLCIKRGFVY